MTAYFKLKSCPFCGSEARFGYNSDNLLIECSDDTCCAILRTLKGPDNYRNREKLAKQWNLRPAEQKLESALEQLLFALGDPGTDVSKKIEEAQAILDKSKRMEWIK